MRKKTIKLLSTHIPPNAAREVYRVIESGWINRGEKAREFEELFARKFGFKYALSVNSCTSALRLAYTIAKQRGHGNEVITTPWTAVATNTALIEAGLKPVFADIRYETANIDPQSVENKITNKACAIIMVHYAGYPCQIDAIKNVANDYEALIIHDAAQALGAMYKGYYVGKFEDFACFSFQATKHITTGDGGMFVTENPLIYGEAKERSWFGIDKDKRINSPLGKYPKDITHLGFKYAMNDIAATLGIEGLKDFDETFKKRARIAQKYRDELVDVKGLNLMLQEPSKIHANWMFPIHVQRRLVFARKMLEKGIEVSIHNWRNDKYTIFGGLKDLPNTKRLNNDIIHIPLHAELTNKEVEYIISTIRGLKW